MSSNRRRCVADCAVSRGGARGAKDRHARPSTPIIILRGSAVKAVLSAVKRPTACSSLPHSPFESFLPLCCVPQAQSQMPLLWCGISRNATLLAECGEREPAVDKLAKRILAMKPTAGWEFCSAGKLQAVKLHVYESKKLVWSASCVHDHDAQAAKGLLEKMMLMTEPLRLSGSMHRSFAAGCIRPMLQQRWIRRTSWAGRQG